jgi:hypothetical protein
MRRAYQDDLDNLPSGTITAFCTHGTPSGADKTTPPRRSARMPISFFLSHDLQSPVFIEDNGINATQQQILWGIMETVMERHDSLFKCIVPEKYIDRSPIEKRSILDSMENSRELFPIAFRIFASNFGILSQPADRTSSREG